MERREKVSDKDFQALSVTKNGIFPQLENVAKSNDGDNRKKVCKNDFVINSRSDRKGSSGVSSLDGSVSLINIVLQPRAGIVPSFCNYLLKSSSFVEEYYRNGRGIVADLWTTRYDEMKSIKLAVPPIEEQEVMAEYLDKATAKIDEAISQQQRMIDLLNERKQIIIQKAVTKGLNPNVTMKDSGSEWIGKIPEHWKIIPIKRIANLSSGSTPKSSNERFWDGTIKWITPADFKTETKYIGESSRHITEEGQKSCSTKLIPKNSVVFSKRAPVGQVSITTDDLCINQGCIGCIPNELIETEFLFYLLSCYKNEFESISGGTTFKEISMQSFASFKVPIPSIEEQREIVQTIISKTSPYISEIEFCQQMITYLLERKQIIINEVVTGKVKVI